MRMLASRKTINAQKVLLRTFIRFLKDNGLENPLLAPPESRLSVASDFETTFCIALGQVLVKVIAQNYI